MLSRLYASATFRKSAGQAVVCLGGVVPWVIKRQIMLLYLAETPA